MLCTALLTPFLFTYISVDNEAPLVTSGISRSASCLVHRDRVCVCMFIEVIVCVCCERLLCAV
jgi:hypothetical protein